MLRECPLLKKLVLSCRRSVEKTEQPKVFCQTSNGELNSWCGGVMTPVRCVPANTHVFWLFLLQLSRAFQGFALLFGGGWVNCVFFKTNCIFIGVLQCLKSKHKHCVPHIGAVCVWYLIYFLWTVHYWRVDANGWLSSHSLFKYVIVLKLFFFFFFQSDRIC